jgi:uncharacterized protein YecA (UPF0149 family)
LFDGDDKPLRELVTDRSVDQFVRNAALDALTFLAFERRIDGAAFEAFLLQLDEAKLIEPQAAPVWFAWMTAVGVLGLMSLEGRVRAAFADERIDPTWCDEKHFNKLLQAAIESPNDRTRLESERLGYIEDVLAALEKFPDGQDDDRDSEGATDGGQRLTNWMPGLPVHNPFRDVGRNDPCPCGSGKKFKKCCLPTV